MTPSEFIALLNRPLADLPRELEMLPLPGPFNVEIRPPGSKSLTNRALLLSALAEGDSVITGALINADDAQVMIEALRQLGAEITVEDGKDPSNPDRKEGGSRGEQSHSTNAHASLRIRGTAGRLRGNCTLNLKNAGTATRFLTAAACLADGPVIIDGNERMRQRPIGELVAMLRQLGVTVDELGKPGCVPLRVHPLDRATANDRLRVGITQSSQFISALLLISPWLPRGIRCDFTADPTSWPYISMTASMLERGLGPSGYKVAGGIDERFLAAPPISRATFSRWDVEPDASSATYLWAAASLVNESRCATPGLGNTSLQIDFELLDVLRTMGSDGQHDSFNSQAKAGGPLQGAEYDFDEMPDAAMTLAAVACFAEGITTITGLRTLRVKETDRLAAMQTELSKLGARVEIFQTPNPSGKGPPDEGLRITPPHGGIDCSASAPRIVFDTYDDHRMAMSLALIGLRRPNVVIRDPACVAKTYPTFWAHLSLLYSSAISGGALTRSE